MIRLFGRSISARRKLQIVNPNLVVGQIYLLGITTDEI